MQSIAALLVEPAWWLQKVAVPLLIALFVAGFGPKVVSLAKRWFRSQLRRLKMRGLRKIQRARRSEYQVWYAIQRASVHYALFLVSMFAYYFSLLLFPSFGAARPAVTFFLLLPTLAFEFAWLFSESHAKELFAARQRLVRRQLPGGTRVA